MYNNGLIYIYLYGLSNMHRMSWFIKFCCGVPEFFQISIPDKVIQKLSPRTTADGSFLFNACSFALIGDESLASCLRTLISIAFYFHAECHSFHPYIEKFTK